MRLAELWLRRLAECDELVESTRLGMEVQSKCVDRVDGVSCLSRAYKALSGRPHLRDASYDLLRVGGCVECVARAERVVEHFNARRRKARVVNNLIRLGYEFRRRESVDKLFPGTRKFLKRSLKGLSDEELLKFIVEVLGAAQEMLGKVEEGVYVLEGSSSFRLRNMVLGVEGSLGALINQFSWLAYEEWRKGLEGEKSE